MNFLTFMLPLFSKSVKLKIYELKIPDCTYTIRYFHLCDSDLSFHSLTSFPFPLFQRSLFHSAPRSLSLFHPRPPMALLPQFPYHLLLRSDLRRSYQIRLLADFGLDDPANTVTLKMDSGLTTISKVRQVIILCNLV